MKFDDFLSRINPFFIEKNIAFGYQRKNCKKHGHFKKCIFHKTNIVTYEIKIEKYDNDAAKIYTLAHEFTHLINDHLDSKILTYAQKEWVADIVGKNIIEILNMRSELDDSNLAKKWNIDTYGESYIKGRKISKQRLEIMDNQVDKSMYILTKMLDY